MRPIFICSFAMLWLTCTAAFATENAFQSECGYLTSAMSFENQLDHVVVDRSLDSGPNRFTLKAADTAWAGYYFPFEKGGITARWQLPKKPFRYPLPNEVESWQGLKTLQSWTPAQISKLSPVEKFDILNRQYDFPATRSERENRSTYREPKPEDWEGFCNGRCAAAVNLPEPKGSIVVKNGDGIVVEFHPNDLKALGAASYFYVEKYAQLGFPSQANHQRRLQEPPHPAVLDMTLRHYLARYKKGFVIDDHKGSEIWNVTVVGYDRKLGTIKPLNRRESRFAPDGSTYQVDVNTTVRIVGEPKLNQLDGVTGPNIEAGGDLTETRLWTYRLFLDESEQIVGGRYLWNRGPDFAWFAAGQGTESVYGTNPSLRHDVINTLFQYAQKSENIRKNGSLILP